MIIALHLAIIVLLAHPIFAYYEQLKVISYYGLANMNTLITDQYVLFDIINHVQYNGVNRQVTIPELYGNQTVLMFNGAPLNIFVENYNCNQVEGNYQIQTDVEISTAKFTTLGDGQIPINEDSRNIFSQSSSTQLLTSVQQYCPDAKSIKISPVFMLSLIESINYTSFNGQSYLIQQDQLTNICDDIYHKLSSYANSVFTGNVAQINPAKDVVTMDFSLNYPYAIRIDTIKNTVVYSGTVYGGDCVLTGGGPGFTWRYTFPIFLGFYPGIAMTNSLNNANMISSSVSSIPWSLPPLVVLPNGLPVFLSDQFNDGYQTAWGVFSSNWTFNYLKFQYKPFNSIFTMQTNVFFWSLVQIYMNQGELGIYSKSLISNCVTNTIKGCNLTTKMLQMEKDMVIWTQGIVSLDSGLKLRTMQSITKLYNSRTVLQLVRYKSLIKVTRAHVEMYPYRKINIVGILVKPKCPLFNNVSIDCIKTDVSLSNQLTNSKSGSLTKSAQYTETSGNSQSPSSNMSDSRTQTWLDTKSISKSGTSSKTSSKSLNDSKSTSGTHDITFSDEVSHSVTNNESISINTNTATPIVSHSETVTSSKNNTETDEPSVSDSVSSIGTNTISGNSVSKYDTDSQSGIETKTITLSEPLSISSSDLSNSVTKSDRLSHTKSRSCCDNTLSRSQGTLSLTNSLTLSDSYESTTSRSRSDSVTNARTRSNSLSAKPSSSSSITNAKTRSNSLSVQMSNTYTKTKKNVVLPPPLVRSKSHSISLSDSKTKSGISGGIYNKFIGRFPGINYFGDNISVRVNVSTLKKPGSIYYQVEITRAVTSVSTYDSAVDLKIRIDSNNIKTICNSIGLPYSSAYADYEPTVPGWRMNLYCSTTWSGTGIMPTCGMRYASPFGVVFTIYKIYCG